MEKKILQFTSEIKGIDEKEGTLTAYVSTDARDRHNEVILPDGGDFKAFRKNPVVLWAHDYTMPPIGKAMWVKSDGKGVLSKVKFASTQFAQEVFQLYKDGIMSAFSIGFMPKEWDDGDGDKKPYRTYKKWDLLEYSAVPVPANPEAVSLAITKGLIKDKALLDCLTPKKKVEEDWTASSDMPTEIVTLSSDLPIAKTIHIDTSGLDQRIKDLEKELQGRDDEIARLKFKLYEVLTKLDQKRSEMTADDLAAKTVEIISGVIRRAQGKVD